MRKLVCTILGAVMALGVAGTVHADPAPKVLVCKYVGKPGVSERLKGGKNPISVSANSLPGYDGSEPKPGDEFADAHERSVVVSEGADTCPAPIVRYKLVVRMTGIKQGPYRTHLSAPRGAHITETAHVTCPFPGGPDRRVAAFFDGSVGPRSFAVGPFASRHGPILRIYSEATLLISDRASSHC